MTDIDKEAEVKKFRIQITKLELDKSMQMLNE